MPRVFFCEGGVFEEVSETLKERTINWYNPNYPISSLPYEIAFSNGREPINYTSNFN